MIAAGLSTIIWDFRWLHRIFLPIWHWLRRPRGTPNVQDNEAPDTLTARSASIQVQSDEERAIRLRNPSSLQSRASGTPDNRSHSSVVEESEAPFTEQMAERVVPSNIQINTTTWKTGIYILASFLVVFITIMVVRGVLKTPPRGYALFANLYLAGTIIFGGGPVVIPLLREYIVAEGWVSPRDFLLGLAIIQAFPGPNFNFAVFLGSLATVGTSLPSFAGAILAFLGIFTPGIVIIAGIMGLWKVLRSRRWLLSLLRGVNACAVGLVFTAVYKLWQIGFVDADHQNGAPLGRDPWWVAITATSFVGGAWFGLSAPFAIILGGVMGMAWFAVVKT